MKSQWLFGKNKNYAVAWEIENPKAIVQIFHGIVEHSHRYEPLALRLNQLGFSVYSHDQVGHGRTAGTEAKFGVMDGNWRNYVEDAHLLTQQIRKRNPDVPIFFARTIDGIFCRASLFGKIRKKYCWSDSHWRCESSVLRILSRHCACQGNPSVHGTKLPKQIARILCNEQVQSVVSREKIKSYLADDGS